MTILTPHQRLSSPEAFKYGLYAKHRPRQSRGGGEAVETAKVQFLLHHSFHLVNSLEKFLVAPGGAPNLLPLVG